MPIDLHKDCRRRLVELLQNALADISVGHGHFIESGSSDALFRTDSALPQTGTVHESLLKYVGEAPCYGFIYETLSRELLDGQEYVAEAAPRPLASVTGYEDLAGVASRLVEALCLLPREYQLT